MSKAIMCADVQIGGGAPVSIQSMTNTDTRDVAATTAQILDLASAGCEIVRLAVPDAAAGEAFGKIKAELKTRGFSIPMVADIHFDYRLALLAIEQGADKIRINPGNIGSADRIREVANAAAAAGIPIRVGVNSGSLERKLLEKYGGVVPEALTESALLNAERLERFGFSDIVISMKSSDVRLNCEAYRLAREQADYPLHVGVTEAGSGTRAIVKSAVGIGALLLDGIGDTVRVSLTGNPVDEVEAARNILEASGVREATIDLISCPTCGRTRVDLPALAGRLEARIPDLVRERRRRGLPPGLRVAVMGCAVNGPGEARGADLGVACGIGEGLIFSKGEIIKKVPESEILRELEKLILTHKK